MVMEAHCPDCNTELIPSIVGYICHNCGTSHSFEKMATHQTHATQKASHHTKHTSHLTEIVHKPTKKPIRHKLKRFVVPQVATPYSETVQDD